MIYNCVNFCQLPSTAVDHLLQYVNRNTCFRLLNEKSEKKRKPKTFLRKEIFPNGKSLCDVFALIKSADQSYCLLHENATNFKNAVLQVTNSNFIKSFNRQLHTLLRSKKKFDSTIWSGKSSEQKIFAEISEQKSFSRRRCRRMAYLQQASCVHNENDGKKNIKASSIEQ